MLLVILPERQTYIDTLPGKPSHVVTVLLALLGRLDLTMLTALHSLLLLFFPPHGMLAPQPGIKPVLPALAAQSLNP